MRRNKEIKIGLIDIYSHNPFTLSSMGNKITPNTMGKLYKIRNKILWRLADNRRYISRHYIK